MGLLFLNELVNIFQLFSLISSMVNTDSYNSHI